MNVFAPVALIASVLMIVPATAGRVTILVPPKHCETIVPDGPDASVCTATPATAWPVNDRRTHGNFGGTRKISYGGPQTITCFQSGYVVFQHVGASFVRSETGPNWLKLSFKINGQRRRIDVPTTDMSCLIEDLGEESVPILAVKR